MHNQSALKSYELVVKDFCECIISLPEALFLSPMSGWSPRDVVAHLIGWNRQMIDASAAILRGETPAYYADAPNDYRNINAGFVNQYASHDRRLNCSKSSDVRWKNSSDMSSHSTRVS